MAKKKRSTENRKTVAAFKHNEASRKNIPTAKYQSAMWKDQQNPTSIIWATR